MGTLSTAIVDIAPNLKPLQSGLGQARTMLRGFTQGMDVRIPITVAMGAGGASLAGLVAGIGEAAVKAAKLNEAIAKVKITFGPEAGGIFANTESLATKFGVVKTEAADMAAQFALLGRAGGMNLADQVKFAKEFSQLSIDLASFHDTSRGEAVRKLLSGLEGMHRPLREFGIFINETKVKAEAASLGLARYGEELSDEARLMARISIIRREASIAHGDAERSLGRASEQMKKFWGDLENAQAEFGKNLQEPLKEGILLARQLGERIAEWARKSGVTGASIGEGAQSVFRTFRFATTPMPREAALKFQTDLMKNAGDQLELWLRKQLGLESIPGTEAIKKRLAARLDETTRFVEKTLKMPTEIPAETAEESQKAYWDKVREIGKRLSAETVNAQNGMSEAIRNIGSDFLYGINFKLRDWMTRNLQLAGPGAKPTADFKKMMTEMLGKVPEVPRFEREEPLIGRPIIALTSALEKLGVILGGPERFLAREKEKFPQLTVRMPGEVRAMQRPPSRMFGDPAEFAQEAITGILSEGGPQKQQIELLKDARDELKEIKNRFIDTVNQLRNILPGVRPRGG